PSRGRRWPPRRGRGSFERSDLWASKTPVSALLDASIGLRRTLGSVYLGCQAVRRWGVWLGRGLLWSGLGCLSVGSGVAGASGVGVAAGGARTAVQKAAIWSVPPAATATPPTSRTVSPATALTTRARDSQARIRRRGGAAVTSLRARTNAATAASRPASSSRRAGRAARSSRCTSWARSGPPDARE